MKLHKNLVAALLAGLLALGAVACETNGEDPLTDDPGADDPMTDTEDDPTVEETPTD